MKPVNLKMTAFGSYVAETAVAFDAFKSGLFLITGDTGAGKTTIFDAIVFALYGISSGSERTPEMMHSDYVDKSVDTVVELEFIQNRKKYRVKRTLHFQKARGKSDEYSGAKISAVLTEPDGNPIEGSTKVTDRVKSILGLDANQFRQIVMLAQGDFKRFLKSDSEKKSEILGKLFDNSAYLRYQDLIKEACDKLASERKTNRQKIVSTMEQTFLSPEASEEFPPTLWIEGNLSLSDDLARLVEYEKSCVDESETLLKERKEELDKLNTEKGTVETHNLLLEELEAKKKHQAELNDRKDWFAQKKEQGSVVARAYRKVMPALERSREAEKNLDSLKKSIDSLEKKIVISDEKKQKTEEAVRSDQPKRDRIEELTRELQTLSDSLPTYESLKKITKDIAEREEKTRKDEKTLEETGQTLKALKDQLEADRAESKLLNDAEANRLTKEGILSDKKKTREELTGKNGLRDRIKFIRENERKLDEKKEDLRTVSGDALRAKEKYDEMYRRYFDGQSGLLAEEIRKELNENGSAVCPVCKTHFVAGQEHHFAQLEEGVPSQEEVETAKADFEQKEAARAEKVNEIDLLRNNIELGKTDSLAAAQKLFEDCEDWEMLSGEGYLSDKATNLDNDIRNLNNEINELKEKQNRFQFLQDRIRKNEPKIVEFTGTESALTTSIEKEKESLKKEIERLKETKKGLKYESEEEVNDAIYTLTLEKEELSAAIDGHILENTRAHQEYNTLTGALNTEKSKLPAAEEKCAEAEKTLKKMLEETGFQTVESAESELADIPDPEFWLKENERELQEYENDVKNTGKRIGDLTEQTAGWVKQDLQALEKKIDDANRKYEDANQRVRSQTILLQNHKRVFESVSAEKKKLSETEQMWKMLSRLSDLAVGTNSAGGKLSFDRYVMGATFREIIEKANYRLEIMSGGQYQLIHQMEAYRQNAKAGLEIEVLDRNTGIQRESASLSGGESFIVSLALALGLSDVVQSHSGGMASETLFIDEGFGSLDDDVLDKSIQVLKSLSEGNQNLVGIISHVNRLEESIMEKIVVTNSKKGSSLRVISAR